MRFIVAFIAWMCVWMLGWYLQRRLDDREDLSSGQVKTRRAALAVATFAGLYAPIPWT